MFLTFCKSPSLSLLLQQHMDPTDIVLVPYEVDRLAIFVICVIAASLGLEIATASFLTVVPSLFREWLATTALFCMAAVVCGTPPTRDVYHTFWACSYVSTLVIILSGRTSHNQNPGGWHSRLVLPLLPGSQKKAKERWLFDAQLLSVCQVHATGFVTIPFQVLRLYDWGSQIQRWPLPILLGSTYGFVLGSIVGCILIVLIRYRPTIAGCYQSWTMRSTDASISKHQD